MKAIIHTKLILEDGILWDGALTYDNGRILEVGPADSVTIPEGTEILDAGGLYTPLALLTSITTALGKMPSTTSR